MMQVRDTKITYTYPDIYPNDYILCNFAIIISNESGINRHPKTRLTKWHR